MYILIKLCKMPCPLNLVLEKLKYLWFHLTFWVVISNGSLKLPMLLTHTLVILKNRLQIY